MGTTELATRVGFELELLAPRGASRADLAAAVAVTSGGEVHRRFHRDSEPSAVPGMGSFRHLTPGFDVRTGDGGWVCSVVDDVTLVADLDARAAPLPGWHRVLTDDARLLNLLAELCRPEAPLAEVLDPVAEVFGTGVVAGPAGIRKVADRDGATVAMAAPLPGERHRPAEVVTPPLVEDHAGVLAGLLGEARRLGFTVPREAAVHLHVDAPPLRSPRALANLVTLWGPWGGALRRLLGTNPACRRLAPPPPELVALVPRLRELRSWPEAVEAVSGVKLTKFADLNLTALVAAPAVKDTVEVRVLPGALTADEVIEPAVIVEGLLAACRHLDALPEPSGLPGADVETLHRLGGGG
jgi:hypothetical protein